MEPSKVTEKGGQEPLNAMDGWITGGTIFIGGDLGQLGKEAFIAGGTSTVCLSAMVIVCFSSPDKMTLWVPDAENNEFVVKSPFTSKVPAVIKLRIA